MSTIRLDRLLANLGYGSRKDVALLARQGRIKLGGKRVFSADEAIKLADILAGVLSVDDTAIDPPSPMSVMLNKPAGYSCSHEEKGALIYDLLPPRWKLRKPALSAAGRLDKESTGQVILTDDGELLHRIIHPKHHAPKHYQVGLAQDVRGDEAALFATGSFIMQGDPKPLKPAIWQASGTKSGLMILQEGRYHQIRRMFKTLGNQVETLHRIQTGALALGDLAEGEHRILTAAEIGLIWAWVVGQFEI